ncbi:hypothetical protein PUN28_001304 [Cardiocondyla obscurior]|uniref:Uncharacterized protein n=1 Tax=Cardiocondyla obscurior TaxID=286306 RepID=A0AAW2H494_9HYME
MLRVLIIMSFICSLNLLSARPTEEPTKFTLSSVQNNANNVTSSKLEDTQQINNEFRNNLDPLIKSEKSQSRRSILSIPASQSTTPIVLFAPMSRETVRLENETAQAILEKRKPDNILSRFLTPKPLVDRIREEEKYGNTGKYPSFSRAVVNGYENLSNFLNFLVNLPVGIVKQTSRGVTQTLDEVGARLIGLQ